MFYFYLQTDIEEAVKVLLALKAEYKSSTGKDYTPVNTPTPKQNKKNEIKQEPINDNEKIANDLNSKITEQGDKVRSMKSSGASKVLLWL